MPILNADLEILHDLSDMGGSLQFTPPEAECGETVKCGAEDGFPLGAAVRWAAAQGGGIAVFDATDPLQEPQAGDSPLVTFLGCLWSDNTAGDIQTRDTFADGVYNTLLYKTFTPTGSPTKAPTVSPGAHSEPFALTL